MKISISTLLLASLLVLLNFGCEKNILVEERGAHPQASSVIASQTLYSMIPGNEDQVYQLELMQMADGNSEVVRKVVSYDPNQDYSNYHYVGAVASADEEGISHIDFSSTFWFVPFDNELEPTLVNIGGGTINVNCYCSLSGYCNAKTTWGPDGTITSECTSNGCNGNCNATIYHDTNGMVVSVPGLFVSAANVTTL